MPHDVSAVESEYQGCFRLVAGREDAKSDRALPGQTHVCRSCGGGAEEKSTIGSSTLPVPTVAPTLPPEVTLYPSVAFGTRGRETFRLPAAPSLAIGVALRPRRLVPKDPWF